MSERQCSRVLVLRKLWGRGPERRRYPVLPGAPVLSRYYVGGGCYEVVCDVHDYRPEPICLQEWHASVPTEATKR